MQSQHVGLPAGQTAQLHLAVWLADWSSQVTYVSLQGVLGHAALDDISSFIDDTLGVL